MKKFLIIGATGCFLSVLLGAFGAHSLKNILPESQLLTFKTATYYMFMHSLALLVLPILAKTFSVNLNLSASFLLSGILLFSGSLYIHVLTQMHIWVYITPIGGLAFLSGWGHLLYTLIRNKE